MIPRMILTGSALAGGTVLMLVDSAAKGGILFMLAIILAACMRKSSSAARHQLWLCVLAGALLLPLAFCCLPQWRVLPPWMRWEEMPRLFAGEVFPLGSGDHEEMPLPFSVPGAGEEMMPVRYEAASTMEEASPVHAPARESLRVSARWIIGVWAAGAVVLLLPLAMSVISLRRRASRCPRLESGPLVDAMEEVKRELSMKRRIVLLSGDRGSMPMVWGIFRCHLLLPEEAESWQPERLKSVLLHEISHLRRHDPLSLAIAHLALSLHWFNPLAWVAMRRLRVEQESACDDCVLRHGVRSSDYAMELLAVSSSHRVGMASLSALTMARPAGIESRITGILDDTRNRRDRTRACVLGCASSALLAAAFLSVLRAGEPEKSVRGRILDRDGVVLAETDGNEVRRYPMHGSAAHLVGHVARSVGVPGEEGSRGMERTHDKTLAAGEDLKLTLDSKVQRLVETEMKNGGITSGAAVVLDCRNGDVLASVSIPSFDPNDFVPVISKDRYDRLQDDPALPLLDRVAVPATPGGAFKVVTALAACHEGKADWRFVCEGHVNFGNSRLACWMWNRDKKGHGELDLHGGILGSCNCYFGSLAQTLGGERMARSAKRLGFGVLSGSGYPAERSGFAGADETSGPGSFEAAMTSIGQGKVLVTPLQLAVLAAAIGNGEKVWIPRLDSAAPVQYRTDLIEQGWKAEDIAVIRSAMSDSVMSKTGTSTRAKSDLIAIAGQSGTAQVARRGTRSNIGWFIGYAPAEDPRFAIAIMAESLANPGPIMGGRVCGPVAKSVFEKIPMDRGE